MMPANPNEELNTGAVYDASKSEQGAQDGGIMMLAKPNEELKTGAVCGQQIRERRRRRGQDRASYSE